MNMQGNQPNQFNPSANTGTTPNQGQQPYVKPGTKKCKKCQVDIPIAAKICPNCRSKQGIGCLAIGGIILGVLILLGIFGSVMDGGDETGTSTTSNGTETAATTGEPVEEVKVAMVVTADSLLEDLENNALKASDTYLDQYVELTGKLETIDSSGKYFSLGPLSDEFTFISVLCNITEEQRATVINFSEGQDVTVVGTITDVGEIMGYSLDVESIK